MILLVTLLVVTVAISALLRLAGCSKKSAVFFASIPWAIANLISLSAFMILRTPEGRMISKTEQFLTGMIPPIVVALIVAFLVRKKEPPQRNAGSRPPSDDLPASETSSSLGPRG